MNLPLVSCIMPTQNRRRWVAHSLEMFARQTYPNRELIVLDDGQESIVDLTVGLPGVRYAKLAQKINLGAKRNECVRRANSSLIAHWDDDDWQHPERLQKQVDAMQSTAADVCGTDSALYFYTPTQTARRYVYPRTLPPFVLGNTFMYFRSYWEKRHFQNIQIGEDTRFIYGPSCRLHVLKDDLIVGMIHDANTAPKHLAHPVWQLLEPDVVSNLVGDDMTFYRGMKKG